MDRYIRYTLIYISSLASSLQIVEITPHIHELLIGSALHYLAPAEHVYTLTVLYCLDSMRHCDGCPPDHHNIQRILDELLILRIQG